MNLLENNQRKIQVFETNLYGYKLCKRGKHEVDYSYKTIDKIRKFENPEIGKRLAIFNNRTLFRDIFVTPDSSDNKMMREILTGVPISISYPKPTIHSYDFCEGIVPFDWIIESNKLVSLEFLKEASAYHVIKGDLSKIKTKSTIVEYQEKHQDIEQFKSELEKVIEQAIETQEVIISTLEERKNGDSENFNILVKSLKSEWK